MIGRCRAASTWTPMAFIATSIAPFPSPSKMPPTMATPKTGASPMVIIPAIRNGTAAKVISRAPMASASRPPICMARMAAAPPQKSMIAI